MTDITFLVGLPGSGKSYTYRYLYQTTQTALLHKIIDVSQIEDYDVEHLFIEDPYLCIDEIRDRCKVMMNKQYPDIELHWLFWNNDPENAIINVQNRVPHTRVSDWFIKKMLAIQYNPPYISHKVYNSDINKSICN